MRQDRFLFALLIAVGVLVLVALGLFFVQQNARAYGPEETPAGVVRNYLLALQKQEYERAYGYLADGAGKPSQESFNRAFLVSSPELFQIAVHIGEAEAAGDEAAVNLVLIDHNNGPLGEVFREATHATLFRDPTGAWKLTSLPYPYWGFDWYIDNSPNE
jgi:hypothetical protein